MDGGRRKRLNEKFLTSMNYVHDTGAEKSMS